MIRHEKEARERAVQGDVGEVHVEVHARTRGESQRPAHERPEDLEGSAHLHLGPRSVQHSVERALRGQHHGAGGRLRHLHHDSRGVLGRGLDRAAFAQLERVGHPELDQARARVQRQRRSRLDHQTVDAQDRGALHDDLGPMGDLQRVQAVGPRLEDPRHGRAVSAPVHHRNVRRVDGRQLDRAPSRCGRARDGDRAGLLNALGRPRRDVPADDGRLERRAGEGDSLVAADPRGVLGLGGRALRRQAPVSGRVPRSPKGGAG